MGRKGGGMGGAGKVPDNLTGAVRIGNSYFPGDSVRAALRAALRAQEEAGVLARKGGPMGQRDRGLYEKFRVERTDGSDRPGGKHHDCRYFVLDLTHDPHAIPAVLAYANAAEKDGYARLAMDLRATVNKLFGTWPDEYAR